MRAATDVWARLRAELAGEEAFGAVLAAGSPGPDFTLALADWACRTVIALALDAAGAAEDATALRCAPPVTVATLADWDRRLRELVDRLARDPGVAAYERGDYRALVTVLDVDACALAVATDAAARASELPAVACAARLARQLVGPAVVDYDHWRGRALGVPAGVVDHEVDAQHERAERRYRRLFAAEPLVIAALADLVR